MTIKITTLLTTAALALPIAGLAMDVPQRGMSKSQVKAQFGAPASTKPAVGNPPISRWHYDGFTVYFEHNITLHSVRDQPEPTVPKVISNEAAPADNDSHSKNGQTVDEPAAEPQQPEESSSNTSEGVRFDPISGGFVPSQSPSTQQAQPAPKDQEEKASATAEPTSTAADEPAASQPAGHNENADDMRFNPVSGGFVPSRSSATQKAEAVPEEPAATSPTSEPAANDAEPATEEKQQSAGKSAGKEDDEFRFDPVTGRIIISGQQPAPPSTDSDPE